MALQHFVKQTAQHRPNVTSAAAVPLMETPGHRSDNPNRQLSSDMRQPAPAQKPAQKSVASDHVARKPVELTAHDREVLSSLAAVQIRYNRPAEAIPYLMMLRKTDSNDHQAARLLALALVKLGNWEQAEIILEDLKEHDSVTEDFAGSSIIAFYRSLVAFKQRKLSLARQWLQQFRSLVTGSAS